MVFLLFEGQCDVTVQLARKQVLGVRHREEVKDAPRKRRHLFEEEGDSSKTAGASRVGEQPPQSTRRPRDLLRLQPEREGCGVQGWHSTCS